MSKFIKYDYNYVYKIAWGDMDAFGHVNNVTYVKYFETARANYFTHYDIWNPTLNLEGKGPILTHIEMSYRRQVVYPHTLTISTGVVSLQNKTFSMECTMWNESGECVSNGYADFMWFDFKSGRPVPIPEKFKSVPIHNS